MILVSRSTATRAIGASVKDQIINVYAKKELAPPKKKHFFSILMNTGY